MPAADPLARDLDRLVDRLRRVRGHAWGAGEPPLRLRVHSLAQRLADAAADVAGEERHGLPPLPEHALADAVAVTGGDLVDALAAAADGARHPQVAGAVEALRALLAG